MTTATTSPQTNYFLSPESFARNRRGLLWLAIFAPYLLPGCAYKIMLPATSTPETCPVIVTDNRPDPQAMYVREPTIRAEVVPPIATAVRNAICGNAQQNELTSARFVITDFDCVLITMSPDLLGRVIVDLRGRLELPDLAPRELRASNIGTGFFMGRVPAECEKAASQIPQRMATEILSAIRESKTR